MHLKISSLFRLCVRYVSNGGVPAVRAKCVKKYPKNAQSPTIDGLLSDRPDREHGNPLKPDRTRDDVGKNLVNAIVTKFPLT